MFKKIVNRFRHISLLKEKIKLLEKENEHLKNTVVESVELVSDFRRAAGEMNKFINMIYKSQIQNLQGGVDQEVIDQFDELEQEDIEEFKELKKKMTIH